MAVAPALVGAVLAVALGACMSDAPERRTTMLAWSLVDETRDGLELLAIRQACQEIVRTEVDERPDAVEILVIASGPAACEDLGVEETVAVELDAPLGGRELLGCAGARGVACREG